MKKLTTLLFFTVASFNLSAHGEGILSLHIHSESILGLGLALAVLLAIPMYFSWQLISTKEK